MSTSPSELYRIFCVVVGEDTPFSIEILKTKTVSELKKMIKQKKEIKDATADKLQLYRVELDDNNDLVENVKEKMGQSPLPLRATIKLMGVFDGTPGERMIHILVQPPKANPLSLPHTPFIPTKNEDIKKLITEFETNLRTSIDTYLRDNVQLPLWQPHLGSDAVRSHIAGLKIPVISPFSEFPLLLLHNLGKPSHDAQLAERVDRLFRPGSQPRFLCNTSGSGKTRLLLEGLWRHWGLYFTARVRPEGVGSSDLEDVLLDLERSRRLTTITDENRATALAANHYVASRRSLLVLYARMVVFRVFLECASAMPGGITENHKGLWLLMQVAPTTLLSRHDVFSALTQLMGGTSFRYLEGDIQYEFLRVRQLLRLGPRPIFCVLDEAQVLANKFSDCFLSDKEPAQPEPILRQIILAWTSVLPNLIVSGTGVSMRGSETILGSAVAKEGRLEPEMMTDLGAFDNEEDQRAYLEHYLPPGFLDTAPGKAMASRAGYWLHGRHRFTATYISHLIQTGFESPHRVLNDFVYGMTDFRPSDWDDNVPPTVKLEKPNRFDFSSLLNMSEKSERLIKVSGAIPTCIAEPGLLTTAASFVFEYTFIGKIRGLGGPTGDKMVEYGLSRFKKSSEDGSRRAETDEPLAILGLVNFLVKQRLALVTYLTDALNAPNASARGFAFEPFGAYLLARAFSSPRPLSDVFEFVGECKLEDEHAELVMLEKLDDTFTYTPLNINSDIRSSHVLGYSPSTAADTLEWLRNPQGSAFCFPAKDVGPDLILVLRLTSDGTVLRVCVQFEHTKELKSKGMENTIRTTDPFNFLSQFKDDQWTTSDPSMRLNMVEAIQNLGTGTKKAGACGVLRVIFSHPSSPDVDALERAVNGGHGHPLATVPISNLESKDSELGQAILSLASCALENPDRKRKRAEESTGYGTRSKRTKTGTSTG